MTAAGDPIGQLSRALDQAGAIISRVRPDQAKLPTRCSSWNVRALVNHVVLSVEQFTVMVNGGQWEQRDSDVIGSDWAGAYRKASDGLLVAWSRDGALNETLHLPFGDLPAGWRVGQQISELAVHGWDIARATGQSTELDPEIGQSSINWARENLKPEFRGNAFGPEVSVPDDAPIYDRLAGFFGRDPN
jgi:uncharacterized protein (TIGR03086 family)